MPGQIRSNRLRIQPKRKSKKSLRQQTDFWGADLSSQYKPPRRKVSPKSWGAKFDQAAKIRELQEFAGKNRASKQSFIEKAKKLGFTRSDAEHFWKIQQATKK